MGSADMQMTFPGKRRYTDNRCHPNSEDYKILLTMLYFQIKISIWGENATYSGNTIEGKNQFVLLHTTVFNVDSQQHNGRRPVDGTRSVSQPVTKCVTKTVFNEKYFQLPQNIFTAIEKRGIQVIDKYIKQHPKETNLNDPLVISISISSVLLKML